MDSKLKGKKLLWCLICDEKFSIEDIEKGTYYSVTGICADCYKRMWKNEQTCFGKKEVYDETTLECSTFCPDKTICSDFAFSKGVG
jgi:hypothetical protein